MASHASIGQLINMCGILSGISIHTHIYIYTVCMYIHMYYMHYIILCIYIYIHTNAHRMGRFWICMYMNIWSCQPLLISFWAWMGHVDPKSAKDLQHAAAKPEWIHSARSPVRCCPIDTAQHPRLPHSRTKLYKTSVYMYTSANNSPNILENAWKSLTMCSDMQWQTQTWHLLIPKYPQNHPKLSTNIKNIQKLSTTNVCLWDCSTMLCHVPHAACRVRKMRRVASVASRAVRPERTRSTQGRKADNSCAYLIKSNIDG